jgi:hypothetical protein
LASSRASATSPSTTWSTLSRVEQREIVDAHRLAYIAEAPVNWCPGLGTVLETECQTSTVMVAYGWTAWESLRYHGLMRRRVRLGLADPEVSNRFLLWGLMSVFVIAGILLNTIAMARGIRVFQSPSILLASSTTGLAQAVLLVLAFLPPRFYSSWVRGRAASLGA